ncbi:cell division protein PerM [Clavibacter sp. km1a]|uniref:cell division protein PerM n=1 Tax=Clavibacter sp. km1a TaxID=3459136 RepID=UPI004042EDED
MNRHATALFAALEALLVVGVGVALPLVPLTALWAGQYDLQIDWGVFARTAIDLWLLGHGVPLTASLDPALAAAFGLPAVDAPFALSLAPLGFALLTLLLGIRAGRRIVETDHPGIGAIAAVGTTAVLSLGLALAAQHEGIAPAVVRGAVLPTLVLALGLLVGGIARVDRARAGRWWASLSSGRAAAAIRSGRDAFDRLPAGAASVAATAVRGGAAAAFAVVAVSAVVVAVLLGIQYATVITLYETLQTGIVGGVALTLGQLALLPNLVLWTASWLLGPGFAIGTGSSVSPLGTSVGPLPSVPVLGILPQGAFDLGYLGILVPVVVAFVAAVALSPRVSRIPEPEARRWPWFLAAGLGMGIVGAGILALFAVVSGGAAGPGRLADVGPAAGWILLAAFLEIGIASVAGMFVSGLMAPLVRRSAEGRG